MAKIKRTHTFDSELLDQLEQVAKEERRSISEQLAILLEKGLEYHRENKKATTIKRPADQKTAPITA